MINWGIIGAGSIARVFCNGLRFSTTGKALGVASRDGGRAAALAKAFGVSNWTLPRLIEAKAYAARHGLEYFSLVSDQFSLARMVDAWWAGGGGGNSYWASCSEPGFRTWFEETQMALVPWSSQASGFFLDDDQRDAMFDFDRCWRTDDNLERRARARKLAGKYGVRAVNIALAWVLSQGFPVFPIIGSRRPFEIEDSLKALDLRLTEDERRWLDLER